MRVVERAQRPTSRGEGGHSEDGKSAKDKHQGGHLAAGWAFGAPEASVVRTNIRGLTGPKLRGLPHVNFLPAGCIIGV